jgi:hypothetical protein
MALYPRAIGKKEPDFFSYFFCEKPFKNPVILLGCLKSTNRNE